VFQRPVRLDDTVTATAELASVEVRDGRDGWPMATHVDHTSYRAGDGTLLTEWFKTLDRDDRRVDQPAATAASPRYRKSDDELARIEDHYSSEPGSRRGDTTRHIDEVAVGDPPSTIVKGPLTITNVVGFLMGWGSPMCATNRMVHDYLARHPGARLRNPETNVADTLERAHWDPVLARATGMADGYDFGLQRVCWIGHLLTDWCGDDGWLASLEVRLRKPNLLGDTTWITGTVTEVDDRAGPDQGITCSVSGTKQRGEETVTATARLLLPGRA
jgi:acyl dehydratase